MQPEVARVGKGLAALGAAQPVGRVHLEVALDVAGPREALAALLALEGLLPGVRLEVLLEVAVVGEALATVLALEFLPGMDLGVALQVVLSGELLAALAALVGLFARVHAKVQPEVA